MLTEPKVTIHPDTLPGTRVSEYMQINANCFVYAVKVNPEWNDGRTLEWFVEDRSRPCDYFPDLFHLIIRQEKTFAQAIAGI